MTQKELKIIDITQWWGVKFTRHNLIADDCGIVVLDEYDKDCNWRPEIKAGNAYLWNLSVKRDARHKGVAKALMAKAEQVARDAGCENIWLEWGETETQPWVRDWFQRLGYDAHTFNDGYELMRKKLN